jgi:hypothetical protein
MGDRLDTDAAQAFEPLLGEVRRGSVAGRLMRVRAPPIVDRL